MAKLEIVSICAICKGNFKGNETTMRKLPVLVTHKAADGTTTQKVEFKEYRICGNCLVKATNLREVVEEPTLWVGK
jgi:hypothetical protein